uniref:Matrin-type domain-containing protein n=1 Tax=Eptatretus burgeri TaxID=7764 RepID=A0A8C4Q5T3_EPTBU
MAEGISKQTIFLCPKTTYTLMFSDFLIFKSYHFFLMYCNSFCPQRDDLHRPLRSTLPCPSPPRRRPLFCCNICQIRFNSEGQALAHYKGSKHGKKLKASEESKYKNIGNALSPGVSEEDGDTEWSIGRVTLNVQVSQTKTRPASTGHMSKSSPMDTSVVQPACSNLVQENTVQQSVGSHMGKGSAVTTRETEDEKASRLMYCSLCKVAVNSASQLRAHNKGLKHKMMMEARNGGGAIKAFPRHSSKCSIRQPFNRGSELQDKTFYCEICDVYVNSESQLKQHIISRRHKDHIAGRTPKAKFIRCRRRNTWHQSSPPVRAQQHKHPYQMNAASATLSNVFSSSFGLFPTMQPPQTAGPMFSTPVPRSAASFLRFLHPGHGPMRSRCIPVIFAPY